MYSNNRMCIYIHIWQKRPTHTAKEAYAYRKRDLHVCTATTECTHTCMCVSTCMYTDEHIFWYAYNICCTCLRVTSTLPKPQTPIPNPQTPNPKP